jgi:hypothetical protein
MKSLEEWTDHSCMSDPAGRATAIADFRPEISFLNDAVQGLLAHSSWLADYAIDESRLAPVSRATLPIADRLDDILKRDARSLEVHRSPDQRGVGTCRDFALLLLCSFLRCKGVPSRLRCGFASYLGDGWEDHWVCEYWDKQMETWHLSDAEIDEVMKVKCRIDFDSTDVPRELFVTAGQAWSGCRSGKLDASPRDAVAEGTTTLLFGQRMQRTRRTSPIWPDQRDGLRKTATGAISEG